MVLILKILNFTIFILIFILPLIKTQVNVEVTATSGIIDKNIDSTKTMFTFKIECEVNKNISNNITRIDIFITVKKVNDADSTGVNTICNLAPVRVINVSKQTTHLLCRLNLTNTHASFNLEDNLEISSGPTQQSQTGVAVAAIFHFTDFDKISTVINVGRLTLEYLDDRYCKNNNFLFKMISTSIERPLLSTKCNIGLDGDNNHPFAECAIPMIGNNITCKVDVSRKKYRENDKISIKAQSYIPCENGQMIQILQDATNELIIKEECGEIINNNMDFLYIRDLFIVILFFILI